MNLSWEDGFIIKVNAKAGTAAVSANREGLLSLSKHLAALAEEESGSHIHLDAWNSLEDGSAELVIEKIE